MTMLQLTGRVLSRSFGPKIDNKNGSLTLFPWFGSERFLAVSKNKICFKGTNIIGCWRHRKMLRRP
jgi:hypothetical protein